MRMWAGFFAAWLVCAAPALAPAQGQIDGSLDGFQAGPLPPLSSA
jgi:hypothetical protein